MSRVAAQQPSSPSDHREQAVQAAAARHRLPVAVLTAALEAAELVSRHRVRAVPANVIDELVTAAMVPPESPIDVKRK
jgi:hypothetical protein